MSKNRPQANVERLIRALLISSALNVLLIGYSTYSWVKERPPIPYYVLKPVEQKALDTSVAEMGTNQEIIRQFKMMTLDQLVAKLHNQQLVENGYTQRDLALGCLATHHHFNLSRALLGLPPADQQRCLSFKSQKGEVEQLTVYPGLSEQQYQGIIQYASTEQWPFTSQGLYLLYQKPEFLAETSLEETFCLTPEYLAVETLFNRGDIQVEKKELLTLLKEGGWEPLSAFTEQQKMSQDLSPSRRQYLLIDYLNRQSKTAADLLVRTDLDYCTKKLDDQTVVLLLKLLNNKSANGEKFAIEMLKSPRSNVVWQEAALRLFAFAGETPSAPFSRSAALTRFCPQHIQSPTVEQKKATPIATVPPKATKQVKPVPKELANHPAPKHKEPIALAKRISPKPLQRCQNLL